MKVVLKSYNTVLVAQAAAERFKTELTEDCLEWKLALPAQAGEGDLRAYEFENSIQLLLLQARLADDWQIQFQAPEPSPLFLLFSVRGKKECQLDSDHYEINPLQTVVAANPANVPLTLNFKAGEDTLFLLLFIVRKTFKRYLHCLPEDVAAELRAIFSGASSSKFFQKNGEFGLAGASLVQDMLDDKRKGLVRSKYIEAKALEFFSLQLRRWEAEASPPSEKKAALRPEDTEKLMLARNLLIQDLQNAPTIDELAHQAGVNRQKLKQGFKQLFSQTINEYLRNERLKVARQYLLGGKRNVGEIATLVGYDNAGYFARRFREKYGILPSEFISALEEADEG